MNGDSAITSSGGVLLSEGRQLIEAYDVPPRAYLCKMHAICPTVALFHRTDNSYEMEQH